MSLVRTILVAALMIAIVPLAGCPNSAGTQALKKCELNSLPQVFQTVVAEIMSIALNPGSAVSDLEDAGKGLAPGQLSCIGEAILAWLGGNSAPAGSGANVAQALMTASHDVQRDHAMAVLKQYLAAHPNEKPQAAKARAIALLKRYLDDHPAQCYVVAVSGGDPMLVNLPRNDYASAK